LFRSGNHEHPSDRFYNTTVEILPDQLNEESMVWQQYNTTTDGFLIIGSFNMFGVAEGVVDSRVGKLRELRLHVHSESENWVILSEVWQRRFHIFNHKNDNLKLTLFFLIIIHTDLFAKRQHKMIEEFELVMNFSNVIWRAAPLLRL
jgi:hypothetical protein